EEWRALVARRLEVDELARAPRGLARARDGAPRDPVQERRLPDVRAAAEHDSRTPARTARGVEEGAEELHVRDAHGAHPTTRALDLTLNKPATTIRGMTSPGEAPKAPLVGVIMGSTSDLATLQPALDLLAEFEVPFEHRVVSAHRTPDWMFEY